MRIEITQPFMVISNKAIDLDFHINFLAANIIFLVTYKKNENPASPLFVKRSITIQYLSYFNH